jgi:LacI family transcriptional regulator
MTMQVLRKVDERTAIFPFASPDYPSGSRIAADHLLQSGARRVAFVGGIAGRAVVQERMYGYLSALHAAGKETLVLDGRASRSFGREAAQRLARDYPDVDAAICFNDLVALGLLSGFAELGRPVGTGFRLVGFDDIEDCAQVWPSLTSVRCNIAGFGDMIAATLLNWIEDGVQPPPETRTGVELMIRASSGGPAPC